MTRKPTPKSKALTPAKALEAAARPVEVVGHTLERAFDPLASALKRAVLKRAEKQAQQFPTTPSAGPATPAKTAMPVSPLAVPFPKMPPIAGVQMATARAGFYKHDREDLLVMSFPDGASAAGVFTRHGVGSAPVDWCKRHLEATKGEGVRALVVNAGCANSFTGRPG
ncbi:MAG TPA: bifunctional ornithine acetyltransferase/N-acetylglutamate synthase, partial [Phenylobacterium sp.]|nr:bifunctional ornithine acetyltransferase/N-acetylglutamate synthase [Phenylobacterium sp.]